MTKFIEVTDSNQGKKFLINIAIISRLKIGEFQGKEFTVICTDEINGGFSVQESYDEIKEMLMGEK